MNQDKELQNFEKLLKKKFEDTKFFNAQELPPVVPNFTGSLKLDILLHGPFFEGAIVELYGESGSGKTTLALSVLNEAAINNPHKKLLYLDQEMRLRDTLVETFPALANKLKIVQAPTGNDALQIAELWLKQFPGSIVVLDSVDALLPDNDKKIGEAQVGSLPRLMSDGCRKIARSCASAGSTMIFLNQIRSKIGAYGDPDTTSGGKALPFYASQRIQLKQNAQTYRIKDEEGNTIGHNVRFKIVKNSVTVPYVEGDFPLVYGKGIDKVHELVELACDFEVLKKEGSYIYLEENGEFKKRPPKTVRDMMKADDNLYKSILNQVKDLYPEIFANKKVKQKNTEDIVKIDE